MLKRVPEKRRRSRETTPDVLKDVIQELRKVVDGELAQGLTDAEAHRLASTRIEQVYQKFSATLPDEVEEQINSPWPSRRMIKAIHDMQWRYVLSTPDQLFVTSDNPAFYFTSFGIGTEKAEVTFPISSKLALFMSWKRGNSQYLVAKNPALIKEANRRIISSATRFVFSHRQLEWIKIVAAKQEPYLSEIRWSG